jgi:hypothetical protein
MASVKFEVSLDTSHYGPPHPFKDAGVVAGSVADTHTAMVKCLLDVNRSCINRGFQVSPHVKIERIQIQRAWSSCTSSLCSVPIHR